MLKSMRKSKNRYFHHIFCFPWGRPWGNHAKCCSVVWMEREFDAYNLSRFVCPFYYYRFWDTARYLWKNCHFIIPLAFDAPVRGFPSEYWHPLWDGKTRMVSLPDGKIISKISLFVLTWSTNVTDRRTDRHWMTAKTALASHHAVKNHRFSWNCVHSSRFWTGRTSRDQKWKKLHWTDSRVRQNVFLNY